jgi:hypothetical protein
LLSTQKIRVRISARDQFFFFLTFYTDSFFEKKVCISSFNVKSYFVATIFRYRGILIRTRIFCIASKRANHCAILLHGMRTAVTRCCHIKWCSVNFFAQTIKIRGENDGIFGWGFVIWIPAGTKHILSADRLYFYERSSRSWRFYTISKSTLTTLVFWGK